MTPQDLHKYEHCVIEAKILGLGITAEKERFAVHPFGGFPRDYIYLAYDVKQLAVFLEGFEAGVLRRKK